MTPDERTLACQAEVLPEVRCGAVRCGAAARRAVGFATDDVLAATLSISRLRTLRASSWRGPSEADQMGWEQPPRDEDAPETSPETDLHRPV